MPDTLADVVVGNIAVIEHPSEGAIAQVAIRLIFAPPEPFTTGETIQMAVRVRNVDAMPVRELERAALDAAADLLRRAAALDPDALHRVNAATRADEISFSSL